MLKSYKNTLFLTFLAAVSRIFFLNNHDFWFDEAASLSVASKDIISLFEATAYDTHPPLYFIMLKLWSAFSSDITFLRSLSLIFGVLTIPVAYHVFQKLVNNKAAFFASLLLALSSLNIYYSTEIRMYSLLVLETLLLIWLLLRFLQSKKRVYLILIFLAGVAGLYTHYYAILTLLSINLVFAANYKKLHTLIKPWLFTQAATLLSFAPWIVLALQDLATGCWCFNPLVGIPATFASFTIGGMGIVTIKDYIFYGPRYALWIFSISAGLLTILFLTAFRQKKIRKNIKLALLFFTPLAVTTLAGFIYPIFSPRALIIISPLFYLYISTNIEAVKKKSIRVLMKLTVITLLVGVATIQLTHPFFQSLPEIKRGALNSIPKQYAK